MRQELTRAGMQMDHHHSEATTGTGPSGRKGWRRPGLVLSVGVLSSLAVACGGSSSSKTSTSGPPKTAAVTTTTLAASVPAGFTGFSDAADRFTIAVPAAWRTIDPSSPGAAQLKQDLAKSNPALAPVLSGDLVAQGIKYLAVDAAGSAANVIVKPALGARDRDLPTVADQVKAEYAKGGFTIRSSEMVQFAGHAALKITSDLALNKPTGGSTSVHEVQYFIFANDLGYILTLAGSNPQFAAISNTFRVS